MTNNCARRIHHEWIRTDPAIMGEEKGTDSKNGFVIRSLGLIDENNSPGTVPWGSPGPAMITVLPGRHRQFTWRFHYRQTRLDPSIFELYLGDIKTCWDIRANYTSLCVRDRFKMHLLMSVKRSTCVAIVYWQKLLLLRLTILLPQHFITWWCPGLPKTSSSKLDPRTPRPACVRTRLRTGWWAHQGRSCQPIP